MHNYQWEVFIYFLRTHVTYTMFVHPVFFFWLCVNGYHASVYMVVICITMIYRYKAFVFVCYCPIYTEQYRVFLCICVLFSYSYMPVKILKNKLNDNEGPMMKSVAGGLLLP